jgi:NAD(P)-dependent dehydrogenase (short-subunit alcohol dehydrogenase family)
MDLKRPEREATIVTGAGNGLGLAIARRFAAGDGRVLLVDRDPVVEARIGEGGFSPERCFALVHDLREKDAGRVVFAHALKSMGRVDTLINNAAWSLHKPILEMTTEGFDGVVAVNQRAPYFLAQQFFQYVTQSPDKVPDPAIVNIASVNALAGNRNLIAYAGTKGALVAMTRAMAVEMADAGVRVNSISPGAIDTPMNKRVLAEGKLDAQTRFDKYLIKRYTPAEEIAEVVMFLCSPACAMVTGANWLVDGGYLAQ